MIASLVQVNGCLVQINQIFEMFIIYYKYLSRSILHQQMSQNQYNPLQWPPDINLAQLHFDCCKPGIDNTEGRQCPCCNRYQKLSNNRWPVRDIVKDFRNYGGGIPGYFHLLKYLIVILIILCGVAVIYHIMLLNQVCPLLVGTPNHCAATMSVFYFCDTETLYNTLIATGNQSQATALQAIQLATYLILVIATIGIKIMLHFLNKGRNLDGKLFSRFSLMIKNIPLYYQLQDLKKELQQIDSSIVIQEIFYVFKTCECQKNFKALCDLYFRMKQAEQNLQMDDREKFQKEYRKMKGQYLQHFDKYEKELRNLKASSKKVVVVFNTIQQKEKAHKVLRMSEIKKFFHYFSKMLGLKRDSIGYYTQRIAEPQEVYWKYIGQSSTHKMKVRISTTLIGLGLIAASFGIFYIPMLQIDIDKIQSPNIGSPLGFVISFVIFIMMIIYRIVVKALIPYRRPSSRLAQGYFMVLTCTIFNFCFYLISPACFYIFTTTIPNQYKLVELFMNGFSFSIFSLFLNFLDMGYLGFNGKKKKLLSKITVAKAFCQSRLHEEVTPPPFPVAFKIVMVFNVWIFNGFYVFNVPYLLLFFLGVLFLLFWIDKFILYNHYKMQSYLSVQLQHKAQKFFLVIFIICVSLGYYTITQFVWQKWLVLGVFIVGIIINFSLQFFFKKEKDQILKHDSDLRGAIERCKSDAIAANTLSMMDQEMKNSLFLNDPSAFAREISEASLATAIFMYGYQQTYHLYLNQFNNKQTHKMLEHKYLAIKKSISTVSGPRVKKRQSQLAELLDQSLKNKLMDKSKGEILNINSPETAKFLQPPKGEIVRFQSSASQDSKNPQKSKQQLQKERIKPKQQLFSLNDGDKREQNKQRQEQKVQTNQQQEKSELQQDKDQRENNSQKKG